MVPTAASGLLSLNCLGLFVMFLGTHCQARVDLIVRVVNKIRKAWTEEA